MEEEVKKVFYPVLMVSFRRAKKISSYLVRRPEVYSSERTVSSFKCNKSRYKVCLNVIETDTFTSTVTKKTYKISQKLGCSGKCLIYLLICERGVIQYVIKTVDVFHYRCGTITKIVLETMSVIGHA